MEKTKREKFIRKIFDIGVFLKGIGGILEILGGILLLFTGSLSKLIVYLINQELIEDPNDFIATRLHNIIGPLTGSAQLFGAFYLLSHGVVKIILVAGLLRNKLWAYPVSIAVLLIFIFYQAIRFTYTYSIGLALLTIFDLFLLSLIWHEYKYFKSHKNFPQ